MEKVPTLKRHGSNWKNNVEADLSLLLDKKGALGAIITSRSGRRRYPGFSSRASPGRMRTP